jgi:asparagine synthase (glutamine-hydrolysing)
MTMHRILDNFTIDEAIPAAAYATASAANSAASEIDKELIKVSFTPNELEKEWIKLTRIRGEPISLPNEGLIHRVCTQMDADEKVVLTGEGADELLFGYDNIFRWAVSSRDINYESFMSRYGYSTSVYAPRLEQYFYDELKGKRPIDFLEDFFYRVHLPGLLRRMDFASMAASKEARVPFVSKKLISYIYRQPSSVKISNSESKIPIRKYAESLGLNSALRRKKIGFSAKLNSKTSREQDYRNFQDIVMGALEW